MSSEAPTAAEITELLAHWWHRYDEGQIEELRPYLTADATFRTRTDTGTTDWEEFVRADFEGADEIIFWQVKHRAASPHPLRHMTLNVAVDRTDGPAADFRSYLLVTQVVGGARRRSRRGPERHRGPHRRRAEAEPLRADPRHPGLDPPG